MAHPGTRRDPFTTFCFSLQIDYKQIQRGQAFFKSISGLKSESEVIPYHEGGLNNSTHQLIGPVKWPNLVLKIGFTGPPFTLLDWREELLDESRPVTRVTGKIFQLDSAMKPICGWEFVGGWPCKWEGPDFDASKNELAIETLEIAHHGLRFFSG
jgi:phage tail-like protein